MLINKINDKYILDSSELVKKEDLIQKLHSTF